MPFTTLCLYHNNNYVMCTAARFSGTTLTGLRQQPVHLIKYEVLHLASEIVYTCIFLLID